MNSRLTAAYRLLLSAYRLPLVACCLPLLSVFAVSHEFAMGVISAKYYWFYAAMGICGLTTALYLALGNQFKIRFSLAELLLLLFALLGLLPFLTGAEVIHTKAVLLVLLVVLYLYFRIALRVDKSCRYALYLLLLITAAGQALWGMAQLYGYLPSQHNLFLLTGSFFNPGPYAGYLAVLSPLALYYVLRDYRVWSRPYHTKYCLFYLRWSLATITLLSTMLVLPASMSRAAWLAATTGSLFVGLAFFASRYRLKSYVVRYQKKLLVALVLVAFIAGSAGVAMYRLKKDSADGRVLIWKNTLTAIEEQPLGVGLGHFAGAYGKVQAAYFETTTTTATGQEQNVAGNPEYAFNEYLQICLEFGVAGLLLFATAVIMLIKKGIKQQKYGAVGAVVSLLVFASMSYPFSVLPFLIVFVCLLADLANGNEATNPDQTGSTLVPIYVIVIISFGVLAYCLYNRYPTYKAYKEWSRAKTLYAMQLYTDATPEYARITPHLSDRVEFLFEYGQILSKTAHYQKSNEVLTLATTLSCDPMLHNVIGKNHQALKNYKAAELNFLMAANMVPNRIYPYYLLAKLYLQTGNRTKFEKMANHVLQKEPKIHSPAIEEMRNEIEMLKNQMSKN